VVQPEEIITYLVTSPYTRVT